MSSAKQCDRCKKLYLQDLNYSAIGQNWWRYNLSKDCHPYEEVVFDLCNGCKKSLAEWFEKYKEAEK